MKKLAFMLFGASLLFVAGCKKESTDDGSGDNGALVVEKKQRSMLGFVTNTEVAGAGSYAGPEAHKVIDEMGEDNITMLSLHLPSSAASGRLVAHFKKPSSMNNPDSVFISPIGFQLANSLNILNANGQGALPSVSLNGSLIGTSDVPSGQIKTIATDYNANAPQIGVAARKKITGNTISVDIKTETYEELNGDYFVSAIVLEDRVNGYQNGATDPNNYQHRNVVRASMNGGGEMHNQKSVDDMPFASGTVAAGSEYSTTINLNYQRYENINPNYGIIRWDMAPANTKIAVIVWAKITDTKFAYVNSVIAK